MKRANGKIIIIVKAGIETGKWKNITMTNAKQTIRSAFLFKIAHLSLHEMCSEIE